MILGVRTSSPSSNSTVISTMAWGSTASVSSGVPTHSVVDSSEMSSRLPFAPVMAQNPHRPPYIGISLPQADLRRIPSRRSSQNSPSRHLGEALSTVPHQPKPGHIGQTINARGFAYATCCTLQPLVASRCRGQGFRIVYCCPTAAKIPVA